MRFAGVRRIVVKIRKFIKKPLLERPRHHSLSCRAQLLHHAGADAASTKSLKRSDDSRKAVMRIRDVPKGCVALYVGQERHRFVVPTTYLAHRLMTALLDKSAKEFDFCYSNGIRIACQVHTFGEVVWLIQNNHPSAQTLNIAALINDSYESR